MHISIMLVFWFLLRNSVVLAVYLLFSVACFFTVHEHSDTASHKGIEHFEENCEAASKRSAEIVTGILKELAATIKI